VLLRGVKLAQHAVALDDLAAWEGIGSGTFEPGGDLGNRHRHALEMGSRR
jgi:hypothetical protein